MGAEVRLTPAQAGKTYDRAFAGREHELHEGHPSWAAFQRFVRAGWGPGHVQTGTQPPTPPHEAPPEPEEPEVQALTAKGLSIHEAKMVLAARQPNRVQQGTEGTVEGQHPDPEVLERLSRQAYVTKQPASGSY